MGVLTNTQKREFDLWRYRNAPAFLFPYWGRVRLAIKKSLPDKRSNKAALRTIAEHARSLARRGVDPDVTFHETLQMFEKARSAEQVDDICQWVRLVADALGQPCRMNTAAYLLSDLWPLSSRQEVVSVCKCIRVI